MILPDLVDRVQRMPGGGIITDENRWDVAYIESIIHSFRATLLRDLYIKSNKRINPVCFQKFYPVYDASIQEEGFVKFWHPEVISLDGGSDGFRYMGSSEGSEDFRRIVSRARLSTFNRHKVMSVDNNRRTSVLYDGNSQMIEVYGNSLLKYMMTESLLSVPADAPLYNKRFDNYPLSEGDIPMLERMIFMEQTSIEAARPIDTTSSSSESTPPVQQIKR